SHVLEIGRQLVASLAEVGDRLDVSAQAVEREVLQCHDAGRALAQAHRLIFLDSPVDGEDGGEDRGRRGQENFHPAPQALAQTYRRPRLRRGSRAIEARGNGGAPRGGVRRRPPPPGPGALAPPRTPPRPAWRAPGAGEAER